MRLQIFSDLHADVARPRPITVAPDVDAVIVAGDVCEGAKNGFARLRQIVPMQVPIIMVMGNHEYYRSHLASELASARQAAPLYGIHLLENDLVTLGGVRFIGCSLWTDYALFGDPQRAMLVAAEGLNDHRRIKWSKEPWLRFRPQEALLLHKRSRAFIETTLAEPFEGATVVVTHHAPHPGSIHSRYKSDPLTAAYVSNLTAVIEAGRPAFWIHGHVHESFDYSVGTTRVICNPHGYGGENQRFDPALVVEIAS
ncbi:metallophosphoesterase [Pseudolabrys sp. Root1462]|jgi:Icc-related predicted phosphoesterase|uniref:metallophosphoesterase n=1 Tax=Pseudolabrys sp. Root1462 TaxID=1736466 RepID=UPI000702C21F|nr:metallophosphoesterase [Pseudolabrys sp. Root1462]KQY97174.1 metallophosphoesterase [Pseudolabrys sp. Root1462]